MSLRDSRPTKQWPTSVKQICRTVTDGRLVTFHIFDHEPITGYIAGMDDYTWFVIAPNGQQHLVHKSVQRTDLHREKTFQGESRHDEIEKAVGPFRRWCNTNVFGRDEMPQSDDVPSISGRRARQRPQGATA